MLRLSILAAGQSTGGVNLRRQSVASLAISSGRVVAFDPLYPPDIPDPFDLQIAPGSYEVFITFVALGRRYRIAAAGMVLADSEVVDWSVLPLRDDEGLIMEGAWNYAVDSALGCFADADVPAELSRDDYDYDQYWKRVIDAVSEPRPEGCEWAKVTVADGLTLVCFGSGLGDGIYTSYLGVDSEGAPSCLLTDFRVV